MLASGGEGEGARVLSERLRLVGLPALEFWGWQCGSSRDFICEAIVVAGLVRLPW